MDYFYRGKTITLPLTSDKEQLAAEFNDLTPYPEASSTPLKSKFKKALKITVHSLLIMALVLIFGPYFHKKWIRGHRPFPWMRIRMETPSEHFLRHVNHPLQKILYQTPPVEVLNNAMDFTWRENPALHDPDLRCDAMPQWSAAEDLPNNDRYNPGPQFSSNTTFTFFLSSESLSLYAFGSYSTGDVVFVEDATISDDITIDVNVRYWNKEDFDNAQICTLNRRVFGEGVGIFTAVQKYNSNRVNELLFKIYVRFPKSSNGNQVHFKKLQTFLPMFAHEFHNANIHFDALSIISMHAHILAESLSVNYGSLETSGKPIFGNFTATSFLELRAWDGPNIANITMNNAGKEEPTRLLASSGNAPLYANISLVSTKATGGEFAVRANNFGFPLRVQCSVAPIDHTLYLDVNGYDPLVELPATYEGVFSVRTSSPTSRPHMQVAEDVEDPRGEGRTRQITFASMWPETAGNVCWEGHYCDKAKDVGSVNIVSFQQEARLKL